jgi:coenzyme PQQ precursor peptide PqqA
MRQSCGSHPQLRLSRRDNVHRMNIKETTMKEWLKPEITESEAGMEVTSYLPAELDRA